MKHLFVPYDIARQLKEKGFNEPCLGHYYERDNEQVIVIYGEFPPDTSKWLSAPLYQQVIDWFRDKHNVIISVEPRKNGVFKGNREYFISGEWRSNYTEDYMDYYGALTKAIEEALKLI